MKGRKTKNKRLYWMSDKGKLYLIPSPLGDGAAQDVLPSKLLETLPRLDCFVVEEVRTARRFLSAAGLRGHIDNLEFHTLNEHSTAGETEALLELFEDGRDVGLISEAGLPAVADPGAALVALCQKKGIRVVPFAGPSSLMMALMSSGQCGQCFAFNGYLSAKTPQRRGQLQNLEKRSAQLHQTQLFIETPYRNDAMLQDILDVCSEDSLLTLAVNITCPDESIRTKTVGQWKKNKPEIGKRPCVFILSACRG